MAFFPLSRFLSVLVASATALVMSIPLTTAATTGGISTVILTGSANTAPTINSIANQAVPLVNAIQVPGGKSLVLPITATDIDADQLSYTVTVTGTDGKVVANPSITALVKTGNPYLRLTVSYKDANNVQHTNGEMIFQLFRDWTPNTATLIAGLAQSGFFDNLTFHRVVQNFMIQGGDPNGNGMGGPNFRFEDEFKAPLIFTGRGQLAMANSGKDTNGSQFFITLGSPRGLDFNHTIFGQLVRGFDVLEGIADTPVTLQNLSSEKSKPVSPVTITSASVVQNKTDAVLVLSATGFDAPMIVTLTASDGKGNVSTPVSFTAQPVTDTFNDPPFFGKTSDAFVNPGASSSILLPKIDLESDPAAYTYVTSGPMPPSDAFQGQFTSTGLVLKPSKTYRGNFAFRFGVYEQGATGRGSNNFDAVSPALLDISDRQKITIAVGDRKPLGRPLLITTQPNTPLPADQQVATYTDLATATEADFYALINWGDNTVNYGSIKKTGSGRFAVIGAHTYKREGIFPVQITLVGAQSSSGALGSSVVINSTATVTSSSLVASSAAFSATRGRTFSGVVATLKNSASTDAAAHTVTIDWGDGTVTPGKIVKTATGFNVTGQHKYLQPETYSVLVTAFGPGGISTTAHSTATVSGLPPKPFLPPFRLRDSQIAWKTAVLTNTGSGSTLQGRLSGTLTVTNTGVVNSGPAKVHVCLSASMLFEPDQMLVLATLDVADLRKGKSQAFSFVKTAKSDTTLALPVSVNANGVYLITVLSSPHTAPIVTDINHVTVSGPLQAVTK